MRERKQNKTKSECEGEGERYTHRFAAGRAGRWGRRVCRRVWRQGQPLLVLGAAAGAVRAAAGYGPHASDVVAGHAAVKRHVEGIQVSVATRLGVPVLQS